MADMAKFRPDASGLRIPIDQSGRRFPIPSPEAASPTVSDYSRGIIEAQQAGGLRGAAKYILEQTGQLPPEAAAPAELAPAALQGIRQAATLPMAPGPAEDSGTGPRIIRRPGEAPVLTNVAAPFAEIAKARGRDFIETPEGRTDFFGGVPQGVRLGEEPQAAAPVESEASLAAKQQLATEQDPFTAARLREIIREDEAARAPAPAQGFRPALAGKAVFAPTYAALYGPVAQQRAGFEAEQARQQTAEIARATAGVTAAKTAGELAKIQKDLGVNLKPYYTSVTDPDTFETRKELAGWVSEGGTTPVQLTAEDYSNYQTALAGAPSEEARKEIQARFKRFVTGGGI